MPFCHRLLVQDCLQVAGLSTSAVLNFPKVQNVPSTQYNMFLALCFWQLWKRRNAFVFRNEQLSMRQMLVSCSSEATLWWERLPRKQRAVVDAWSQFFGEFIQDTMWCKPLSKFCKFNLTQSCNPWTNANGSFEINKSGGELPPRW